MRIDEHLGFIVHAGAGWVMWVLLALSLVAVAIVLERAIHLVAAREDVHAMSEDLLAFLSEDDPRGASKRLEQSSSVEARIVIAGLGCAEKGATMLQRPVTPFSLRA